MSIRVFLKNIKKVATLQKSENNHILYLLRLITGEDHEAVDEYLRKYRDQFDINATAVLLTGTNLRLLELAIITNDDKMCELLLTHGADPNINIRNHTHSLLYTAMKPNGIFELLLLYGADINEAMRGPELLHTAVDSGHLPCIAAYFDNGGDPNAAFDDGITALHSLLYNYAEHGQSHVQLMTEILLANGANPNIRDSEGHSVADLIPPFMTEIATMVERASQPQIKSVDKSADKSIDKSVDKSADNNDNAAILNTEFV